MTKTKTIEYIDYIKNNTLRCEVSRRGGGIEIDASELLGIDVAGITAYQSYLGGGLTGRVQSSHNFSVGDLSKEKQKTFFELEEVLKEYFFNMTNDEAKDYDEWSAQSYKQNQKMPLSAY